MGKFNYHIIGDEITHSTISYITMPVVAPASACEACMSVLFIKGIQNEAPNGLLACCRFNL